MGRDLAAHASALEDIATLENALAAARLKLESAQKSEEAAQRDKAARQEIIEAVARLTREHGELQESTDMSLPALSQAEDCLKKAQTASDEADKKRKAADAIAAIRRADFDYYNSKLHLEQLQERKERIDQARKNAAKAHEVLARNKMTSRALQAIQEAEKALLTAQAKLETGSPHVRICGLGECRMVIDGVEAALGKGDIRDVPVGDSLRLTIPRKLDIEVRAGASSERLQKKADEANDALQNACKAAGVANADEASKAAEERNEAMRIVKSKDQIETDNLRDLPYEELEQKLLGLRQSVPEYLAKRLDAPTICPDLDSAKKERARAEAAHEAASGEWGATRESIDAARAVRDGLNAKHQEARIQLDQLTRNLKAASEKLDRARQTVPDDALETILANAVATVTSEESAARTAEDSLKAKCPERVRTLADTAEASLQTARNRRTAAQTELIEVQTRLKIQGEEGLHEKLHAAQTHMERIGASNQSLFQRASAAKCLFEIMLDERSKARRAYVAPLKEKIERLGRLVFDDSCEVEISEDLMIASRTAKGVTVPFDSLSGGTKEQLSLIFRLACAMTVAKDGGTPLILDDALGYTDPDRLRLMGAVLAKAAKECQIVIFTCLPDRYSNVGEATVVSLV